jgi:hypothetical protein
MPQFYANRQRRAVGILLQLLIQMVSSPLQHGGSKRALGKEQNDPMKTINPVTILCGAGSGTEQIGRGFIATF